MGLNLSKVLLRKTVSKVAKILWRLPENRFGKGKGRNDEILFSLHKMFRNSQLSSPMKDYTIDKNPWKTSSSSTSHCHLSDFHSGSSKNWLFCHVEDLEKRLVEGKGWKVVSGSVDGVLHERWRERSKRNKERESYNKRIFFFIIIFILKILLYILAQALKSLLSVNWPKGTPVP